MNVLIPFLRGRPDLVDRIAEDEEISVYALAEALQDVDLPYAFGPSIVEALTRDDELGGLLSQGYVRALRAERWYERLESIEDVPVSMDRLRLREWVTFVRGNSSRGVSLPEDEARDAQRLSVFADDGIRVRRVSLEYGLGTDALPAVTASPEDTSTCSLPDWGKCAPGCIGICMPVRVYDDKDGIECHCVKPLPQQYSVLPSVDVAVTTARMR